MFIKAAHDENKTEIEILVGCVVALRDDWKEFIEGGPAVTAEQEAEIGNQSLAIMSRWNVIVGELSKFTPKNETELSSKVKCSVLLNIMDGKSTADRIGEAVLSHDSLSWSIVRDFAAIRLGFPDGEFPSQQAGKL